MSDLHQVSLATGGSSGIGRAICEALRAQGRGVVNLDYKAPDWGHDQRVSLQTDLTKQDEIASAAHKISAAYAVNALVNNASATMPDLDDVVGLHLRAPILLIQAGLTGLTRTLAVAPI